MTEKCHDLPTLLKEFLVSVQYARATKKVRGNVLANWQKMLKKCKVVFQNMECSFALRGELKKREEGGIRLGSDHS